ncbi:MAG: hypothetical protein ACTSXZ_05410, partial [Alphaproteobacteria bacterium]
LPDYVTRVREGGAHLYHWWVVPFFFLFGPSLFAFKLSALVLMILASWVWVDLARHVGGAKSAAAMALLLLLPPPFYLRMALTPSAVTNHLGVAAITGFCLWLLWRWHAIRQPPMSALLTFGLVLGLGVYWAMSFLPLAAGLLLLALLFGRLRRFYLVLLGLLPGVTAWYVLVLKRVFAASRLEISEALLRGKWAEVVVEKRVSEVEAASVFQQIYRLLAVHLPRMAGFTEAEAGRVNSIPCPASWAYYLVFIFCLVGFVFLLRQWRERRVAALFVPALFYLAAFFVSGLDVELQTYDQYRYFLPLFPFAFLLTSLVVGRLRISFREKPLPLGAAGMIVVALLGVAGAGNVVRLKNLPTPYLRLRGYQSVVAFQDLTTYSDWKWDPLRDAGRRDYRLLALQLGFRTALRAATAQGESPVKVINELPPELRDDFAEGFGCYTGGRSPGDFAGRLWLDNLPQENRASFVRGAATCSPEGWAEWPAGRDFPSWLNERVAVRFPGTAVAFEGWLTDAYCRGVGQQVATEAFFFSDNRDLGRYPDCFQQGVARVLASLLLPGEVWPASRPLPLPLEMLGGDAKERFRFWVGEESERIADQARVFQDRPPRL